MGRISHMSAKMTSSKEKKESSEDKNILEKLVPILLLASIVLAFAVGILWQKVSSIEKGTVLPLQANNQGQDQPGQPLEPIEGKLSEEQTQAIPQVEDSEHIRGNKGAKVFLIEYSDMECPFCARFHPTVMQILDEYGDDVAWVYRHFPLDMLHTNARPAAIASECAADIGGNNAFWSFLDILMEDPSRLTDLSSVASEAGIDAGEFEECIDSDKFADEVEDQYQKGISAGISGTPGNFIVKDGNAWFIPGALPFEQIKTIVDEALAS